MTNTAFMKPVYTSLFTLLLMVMTHKVFASDEVILLDGREILLKEDGSWAYLSTDRYATTKDGDRVRLKQDGSWQMMGNAPLISTEQVRTSELDIKLQKVVIESHEKKVQKNTRLKTQTVFYLQLGYSAQAKGNISIKDSDISFIEVKDNNGKNYPVVSIAADTTQLKPDTETTLVVRAAKSPSVLDQVKSMEITLKTGLFGIEQPIRLSLRSIDIDKQRVDGFK